MELANRQAIAGTVSFELSGVGSPQSCSLTAIVTIPASNSWGVPADDQTPYQREKAAFRRKRPELSRTHAGKYVAIHSAEIASSGESAQETADRFFAEYGDTHVYIGFVGNEPPARQILPRLSH